MNSTSTFSFSCRLTIKFDRPFVKEIKYNLLSLSFFLSFLEMENPKQKDRGRYIFISIFDWPMPSTPTRASYESSCVFLNTYDCI